MLGCFNPILGKIWTNPTIGLKLSFKNVCAFVIDMLPTSISCIASLHLQILSRGLMDKVNRVSIGCTLQNLAGNSRSSNYSFPYCFMTTLNSDILFTNCFFHQQYSWGVFIIFGCNQRRIVRAELWVRVKGHHPYCLGYYIIP